MEIFRMLAGVDLEEMFDKINDNCYQSKETGTQWSEWEATLITMAKHREAQRDNDNDPEL